MYALLAAFENVFRGQVYRHRNSTVGDRLAVFLYEDLATLQQSPKFLSRVSENEGAVNCGNKITGKSGRRGDGTFGRVVPGQKLLVEGGFVVPRGLVANLEIGTEVKIGATKLIAQVDRVMNDLSKQAAVFKMHNQNGIRVALVGVNHADTYTGYEGDRLFIAKAPPAREAKDFATRIETEVGPLYDELLILPFKATNNHPFEFNWVDAAGTERLYGSALVRISAEYERRF